MFMQKKEALALLQAPDQGNTRTQTQLPVDTQVCPGVITGRGAQETQHDVIEEGDDDNLMFNEEEPSQID